MKREIKKVVLEWGRHAPHPLDLSADFERLSKRLEQQSIHLAPKSLRRLFLWLSNAKRERPSERTLNRLALFAGFQSWKDLHKALHGTNDAALNYKD